MITVDDEDDAEKDTRGGRESTVQMLLGFYTNMTESEVRPHHFFTRILASAFPGGTFCR